MDFMFNEEKFFGSIRNSLFGGKLSQSQVDNILIIKDEFMDVASDLRWLAYIYGTIYHETAKTFRPIEEYGKGKGKKYGSKIKMSGVPYSTPNKIYYGRGFEQLTWFENYQAMGKKLGLDLLNNPELMLTVPVAAKSIITGMTLGMYTGKKLSDYITKDKTDYVNARRIVNGLDQAERIAGYADKFYLALILK